MSNRKKFFALLGNLLDAAKRGDDLEAEKLVGKLEDMYDTLHLSREDWTPALAIMETISGEKFVQ